MSRRILFIGHSHVRNLKFHVLSPDTDRKDFKTQANVNFLGIGGKTIKWLLSDEVKAKVTRFRPHSIFIMLGDNDIVDHSTSEDIARCLLAAVGTMKKRFPFVLSFVITQLLPRYARSSLIPPPRRVSLHYSLYYPIADGGKRYSEG